MALGTGAGAGCSGPASPRPSSQVDTGRGGRRGRLSHDTPFGSISRGAFIELAGGVRGLTRASAGQSWGPPWAALRPF